MSAEGYTAAEASVSAALAEIDALETVAAPTVKIRMSGEEPAGTR